MDQRAIFLNVPYDKEFEPLFLAYLVGLTGLGLLPRATLELPVSMQRIERIVNLIDSCDYSLHDLSRIQLTLTSPQVPRFNMPFELGMAYYKTRLSANHQCFIFANDHRQFEQSLSDLKGVDILQHSGDPKKLFSELVGAFDSRGQKPSVPAMLEVQQLLLADLNRIFEESGCATVFHPASFKQIVIILIKTWTRRQSKTRSISR